MTGGGAKELLPVAGRTVLDIVLEEARTYADELVVITSPAKPEISRHLDGQARMAEQAEPRGFAHAVRIGVEALPSCDRYLVLLPDTLFPPPGPVARLVSALQDSEIAIAAETVSDQDARRYGIMETRLDEEGRERIVKIIEKPMPWQTSSRLAVSARYGFTRRFAEFLRAACALHGPDEPELSLTPVIGRAISEHAFHGVAVPIEGHRYDCGDPAGYAEAEAAYR